MAENDTLRELLSNPEMLRDYINDNFRIEGGVMVEGDNPEPPPQVEPRIDVPTRPPDRRVRLRGSLNFEAEFLPETIVDVPQADLVQSIVDVLNGERGWWLPTVRFGNIKLWRVQDDRPDDE